MIELLFGGWIISKLFSPSVYVIQTHEIREVSNKPGKKLTKKQLKEENKDWGALIDRTDDHRYLMGRDL